MNFESKTRQELITELQKLQLHEAEKNAILNGITANITERVQTEKALHDRDEYLRDIFLNAPIGIFHSLGDGQFLTANPALAEMLGYSSPEEIIKATSDMTTQIYADPQVRPRIINALIKADGWIHYDDVIWRKKDNSLIRVDMTGRKVLDASGAIEYFEGFIEDITASKRAEEALRESEEKFKAIANYAASWEAWFNREGKLVWMNSYSTILTGFTPEEIITAEDYLSMVIAEEDIPLVLEKFRNALQGKSGDDVEIRINRKDGSKFWASISWRPILDSNGKSLGFRTSTKDITRRKWVEKELELKNEQLLKTNAEKDKFFSIIAHDLRNPFSAFLGLTKMMVDDLYSMKPEEIQKIAMTMRTSATNLYNLLENLLEWSRMKRGITTFEPIQFPLMPEISGNIASEIEAAEKKGIVITYDIPENINVYADRYMLGATIRNLLSNAVKFTPRGGKVHLKTAEIPGNRVEFSISDTGIGMSREISASLFLLDVDTTRKGTEKEPGTGLGLILCKEFVEKHGGTIRVESGEGKGSTFYFSIPSAN